MSRLHKSLATIPNRYAFIDTIEQCAGRHKQFSLMLVDVVRFSDVTTSLGIKVADQFLLEIANRIVLLFDDNVQFGRISGDVFGIVLPNKTRKKDLHAAYEHLVEHFKTPMQHENNAFIADFNVGVVSGSQENFEIGNVH